MNRYKIISPLGDHSYASIVKAEHLQTGEEYAIKQLKRKFYTWQEAMTLKEIKVLRVLQHPYILPLREIIKNGNDLYLVFNYHSETLFTFFHQHRDLGKQIQEFQIKEFGSQILSALEYIHNSGYFHRDVSLDNIYLDSMGNTKLSHFSNAKEINAKPPLTDYLSTRWYRAPEQLLKATNYTFKIDIFAVGCLLAEMILMGPLFSGVSEIDQLSKICEILGTPSHKDWPEFFALAQKSKIQFPHSNGVSFSLIFKNASPELIDLLKKMIVFNPQKRWTCSELLKHKFFTGERDQNNLGMQSNSTNQKFSQNKGEGSNYQVQFDTNNDKSPKQNENSNEQKKIGSLISLISGRKSGLFNQNQQQKSNDENKKEVLISQENKKKDKLHINLGQQQQQQTGDSSEENT